MCGFDEGGKGKWGGENVKYRSVCVALIASQGVGGASGTCVWTNVACGFNFERAGFLYSYCKRHACKRVYKFHRVGVV